MCTYVCLLYYTCTHARTHAYVYVYMYVINHRVCSVGARVCALFVRHRIRIALVAAASDSAGAAVCRPYSSQPPTIDDGMRCRVCWPDCRPSARCADITRHSIGARVPTFADDDQSTWSLRRLSCKGRLGKKNMLSEKRLPVAFSGAASPVAADQSFPAFWW